ncbi:MAG: hypothetical protein K2M60_01880, partial [Lachnospiraceae bacterium]|nr:hypothetical protein [Lachnospiraceae bacterium]
ERSIPYYFSGDYIEKEPSYHRYEAQQDFTKENMERAIQESCYIQIIRKQICLKHWCNIMTIIKPNMGKEMYLQQER